MLPSQIHKRINFNFEKQKLVFDTSRELFSFAKIDEGTKTLLNSLRKNSGIKYDTVLDLGCGYGPIGIFLKKSLPNSDVLCVDRDSLAVEFAEHNAKLNNVKIQAETSLDFSNISKKFDLIICNFPAKLEKDGLEYFIDKSSEFLNKDGTLALVMVKELEQQIDEILKNDKMVLSFKEKTKGYSVFHLKFRDIIKTNTFTYTQNEISFRIDRNIYPLITTDALQEFDTPHFITELIVDKVLNKNFDSYKNIVIINPGQGFLPIAVAHNCSRDKIILASRDLLQLKISEENLKLNAVNYFENVNSDFPQNNGDLLIWSLHDEDTSEVLDKLKIFRENFKKIIIGGRIQIINRVVGNLNLEVKKESKKGKYSLLVI